MHGFMVTRLLIQDLGVKRVCAHGKREVAGTTMGIMLTSTTAETFLNFKKYLAATGPQPPVFTLSMPP